MDKILSIEDLEKRYHTTNGEIFAIKNISLNVYPGEILGIVGSSGCGKSTLLNILADLDKPTSGKISNDDLEFSYMLQSDALLPWLTVIDNACLGLELKKQKNIENINHVRKLLIDFGLESFLNSYPSSLSGGMKQRVALVRTLATKPDIILLDEPLSALDYVTRLTITDDVFRLIKTSNVTAILISHDIAEVVSLCDRIVVLSKRPTEIKNIYEIKLEAPNLPSINRKDKNFIKYYEKIWRDLDKEQQ